MLKAFVERLRQGHQTLPFPGRTPTLPSRFRGRPALDPSSCEDGCRACAEVCPTGAVRAEGGLTLDLGRCLFCQECVAACPTGAIRFTSDFRMAARRREDLVVGVGPYPLATPLDASRRGMFGRSLRFRQVSAGGSAGCEQEANALGNVVFDAARFGIQFVASPRHADGLLITGPVPANMRLALEKTYEAIPPPKIVVAAGTAAISGEPFTESPEAGSGADAVVPVDLYVPGHPPHPVTILDGILRLLGRIGK